MSGDQVNGSPTDDQPTELDNARANYTRSMDLLRHRATQRAVVEGEVDLLKFNANFEMRAAEISAITNLLIDKGIFSKAELFQACAVTAYNQSERIREATEKKPRLITPKA